MERIARPAALLAAVMMTGVSLLLNFVFLASLGRDEHQGYVLGSVSLAADLMKALLPVLMAWAIARRRWIYVVAAAPIFALLVAFSASNAIGFAGQNRAQTLGTRDALSAEQAAVEQGLRELEVERSRLPQHRAPSIVAELVAQAQQNRRFVATDSCRTVNAAPVREFCDGYFRLKAEHAAGVAVSDLTTRINAARARLVALRAKGSAIEADPQARLIAELTGLAPDVARRWLVVLAAVVVEIGSAFGLYLATSYAASGTGQDLGQKDNVRSGGKPDHGI